MANLIITMIGIALFIAISVGGISYVNVGAIAVNQNRELAMSGAAYLIAEYNTHKITQGEPPSVINDFPRAPANLTWSYTPTPDGNYFCLSGPMEESFYNNNINSYEINFNSVYINNACGENTSDYTFNDGDTKAFTIWLDSDYISAHNTTVTGKLYNLGIVLRNSATGNKIISDFITIYRTEDYFIDIELISEDLILQLDPAVDTIADTTVEFVCPDGVTPGCNEGLNRKLKLHSTVEYDDRLLEIVILGGVGERRVNLRVFSKHHFVCNELDPLGDIDFGETSYLLGDIEGNSELAKQQLLCLSNNQIPDVLSSNYKMNANIFFSIDEKTVDWNNDGFSDGVGTSGWVPIGNITNPFTGVFNGNNKFIDNVYIKTFNASDAYIGFFSNISSATISDLELDSIEIHYIVDSGNLFAGALVANAESNSTISNCEVSGSITAKSTGVSVNAGGVVGILKDSIIKNSFLDASIFVLGDSSNPINGGGLVGVCENCTIYQNETKGNALVNNSNGSKLGGIVGYMEGGTISESISKLGLSGEDNVGGIAGYVFGDDLNISSINNCYAISSILSDGDNVGGILGYSDSVNFSNVSLQNNYVENTMFGNSNIGAIVGADNGNTQVLKNYALDDTLTALGNDVYSEIDYCSYSADELCDIEYKVDSMKSYWSDDIWETLEINTPKLEWETPGDIDSLPLWECQSANPLSDIEIDIDGNYLIGGNAGSSNVAKDQLLCLSQNQDVNVLNANYKLTSDVNFEMTFVPAITYKDRYDNGGASSQDATYQFLEDISVGGLISEEDWDGDGNADETGWVGFGSSATPFTGIFDGGDYTINNVYINNALGEQGFFGFSSIGAEINNLNLGNIYIASTNYDVGGLVGYVNGSSISNCSVSGNIKGDMYVGGLVGYSTNNSTFSDCSTSVNVLGIGDHTGGLIGYSSFGDIINSNSISNVSNENSNVGGLIGFAENTIVDGCSSNSSVTNKNWSVGALVGRFNIGGYVKNSHSQGFVNSTVQGYNVGGLIGGIYSSYVEDSSSSAIITADNTDYSGGLIGSVSNGATVKRCKASGDVTSINATILGGLVGDLILSSEVKDSYTTGNISSISSDSVGGLVGHMNSSSIVDNCYTTGDINGPLKVGSIIGYFEDGTVSSSYALNDNNTAIYNYSPSLEDYCSFTFDVGCSIDYSMDSMKYGWSDVSWEKIEEAAPKLEWEVLGDIESLNVWFCDDLDPMRGLETDIDGNYLIGGEAGSSNQAKLQWSCFLSNQDSQTTRGNYIITADILFNEDETLEDWDSDGIADGAGTEGWIPFGSSLNRFRGSLDGQGHSIENIYINRPTQDFQGLFGYTSDATFVRNLNIVNPDITGREYVGALSGYVRGTKVENINVSGGSISGTHNLGGLVGFIGKNGYLSDNSVDSNVLSSSGDDVGGIAGGMKSAYINKCYSTGSISNVGNNVGGIIGLSSGANIYDSYSKMSVINTGDNVGGIIGYSNRGSILYNSYANASVVGNYNIGGAIGYAADTEIYDSYAHLASTPIANDNKGGLIGSIGSKVSIDNIDDLCEYVDEVIVSQCLLPDVSRIHGAGSSIRAISDGIDDYIDTGLNWTPTTKVIIEGRGVDAIPDTYDKITGTLDNFTWIGYARGYFYAGIGDANYIDWVPYDTDDHIFIIDLPNSKLYLDSYTPEVYSGAKPEGPSIFLFARENGGLAIQHMAFNLIRAEIWQDGVMERLFEPQPDGSILDTIHSVVYSNETIDPFVVEIPNGWDRDIWNNLNTSAVPTFK